MSHNLFPLFIDLHSKPVTVYGGGVIAARRVATLCQFGPEITVISPSFAAALDALPCRQVCGVFDPQTLPAAALVLACTDDREVNRRIADLCRSRGIPVNNASDQDQCDFHFPAVALRGPLVVGVNAGGSDHGLVKRVAAKIRTLLESLE